MKKYLMLILSIILSISAINVDACSSEQIDQLRSQLPQDLYTMKYEMVQGLKQNKTDYNYHYEALPTINTYSNLGNGWNLTFWRDRIRSDVTSDIPNVLAFGVNTLYVKNETCGDDIIETLNVFIPQYDFENNTGFTDITTGSRTNTDTKNKFDFAILFMVIITIGLVALIIYFVLYILKQRSNGYE